MLFLQFVQVIELQLYVVIRLCIVG